MSTRIFLVLLLHVAFLPNACCQDRNRHTAGPASTLKVYYGILHTHSALSDGRGEPADAYSYARDTAGLDFFSLADHSEYLDDEAWASLGAIADGFNRDGSFVAFRGFEWSHPEFGHIAVIDSDSLCSVWDPATDTLREFYAFIDAQRCFCFFNHPGRQNGSGLEFEHFAPPVTDKIAGMELWNKSSGFDVFYYNDGYTAGDGAMGFFDEALTSGWRIGASGSDDNHTATYGTENDYRMAVIADALTRTSIRDAITARRFYSTSDKNLKLSFVANGSHMGSVLAPGRISASLGAYDDEEIERIELVGNGKILKAWTVSARDPELHYSFVGKDGEYYYILVHEKDGDMAISSPIWIEDTTGRTHHRTGRDR